MIDTRPESTDEIVAATRHWLARAVIGLNLCPFAKSVYVKDQVRYAVSDATALDTALADLEAELRALEAADPRQIDTTLVIYPHAFADFVDYNDALFFADRLVQ
ncbi:peptidase, partial [Burkholderia multivorans]